MGRNVTYWMKRATRAEKKLSAVLENRSVHKKANKRNPFIGFRIPLVTKEVLEAWGKKQVNEFDRHLSPHQAARRLVIRQIKQIQLEP